MHWSRRTLARDGEHHRDALAPALDRVDGFTATHAALTGDAPTRAAALRAFTARLDPAALPDADRRQLAAWVDATLDVEMYAIDIAATAEATKATPDAKPDAINSAPDATDAMPNATPDVIRAPPAATDAALDAALTLRARLPPRAPTRTAPFPDHAMQPSGSRRVRLAIGLDHHHRAITRLRTGVVDEQPGEARSISLRRSARFEFLVSETAIAWPTPTDPTLVSTHLTLLSTIDHALHVRTTEGPITSRLDLLVDGGIGSHPEAGVAFGGWLRFGQGFTLAAADDDTGFAVIGADLNFTGWVAPGEAARGELGLWTELIAPFTAAHHLRLRARAAPGYGTEGYALHATADLRLDLLVDPSNGVMLEPYARLDHGGPGAHRDNAATLPAWETGIALGW